MRFTALVLVALGLGCARPSVPPPVPGEFRGHWEAGFETSRFVPCGGGLAGGAWVEWEDSAYTRALRHWPRVREQDGVIRYYVRWRGTLRGPAPVVDSAGRRLWPTQGYGHLGMSRYELRISDVLEMRAPGRRDCDRATGG